MSYSGLLPEDYSYAKNLAEQRKNNALKVNNPIKANATVGNTNLKGMQLKRGMMKDSLKIQELKASGQIGQAQQLQIQAARQGQQTNWLSKLLERGSAEKLGMTFDAAHSGATLGMKIPEVTTAAQKEIARQSVEAGKNVVQTGKNIADASKVASAKIFDGTKAGFQKGMNAIALGATVIEKWGQRFAKKGWKGVQAVDKTVALHPGLVDDEYV